MHALRYVAGAILALVAGLLGAFGLMVLTLSLQSSREGPYLPFAVVVLLLALPFALASRWSFSRDTHPLGWGLLALVAGAATALSLTPPARYLGPLLAPILRLAFPCLTLGAAIAAVQDWRVDREERVA